MTRKLTPMLLPLTLAACIGGGGGGGDYTIDDIESGDLAGMIGGAEWKMVEPLVEIDSFDDTRLSVTVFAEDVEDCGFAVSSDLPFVLFSMPAVTGEYPLSFSFSADGQTVTLVEPPAMNNIAAEGIIDLVIDGDSIEMGLVAYADEDNNVNGRFSTTLCSDEEM